jgi:hypothetical protein
MGNWFSKTEETKTVENDGQVTNNVIVNDTVSVHNSEIIIMLLIITSIKLIEFIYFVYNSHNKRLRKKFIKSKLNFNQSNV